MTGDAIGRVVDALRARGRRTESRGQGQYMAQCPSHDDRTPSLSVSQGDAGALLHCFAGCETRAVAAALGLSIYELYDDYGESASATAANHLADMARERLRELLAGSAAGNPTEHIDLAAAGAQEAEYGYESAEGAPLFRVMRRPGKQFTQQRWDPDAGSWVNGLADVDRVLFRLPQVLAARALGQPIWVAEGEKDVLALEAAGVTATTSPQGASSWSKVADHSREVLADAQVIVIADKDDPGRTHAEAIRDSLSDVAESVLVVEALEGKDAFDHLMTGHRLDEFVPWNDAADDSGRSAPPLPPGMTGADVLDRIAAVIRRFVVMPSEGALVAAVLFIAHTHAVEAADSTPYLHVTSPERRSGKTQLLEVLAELVANPLHASSASASAIYRGLVDSDGNRATLLLDEVDTVFGTGGMSESGEALRNVLNAGNRRKSARVIRTNRNTGKNEYFDCFGPKVLGGIGSMPDTVEDRSIQIPMARALEHELAELSWASAREVDAACSEVRPLVARWASDAEDDAGQLRPERVSGLNPRAWDAWEPLIALAQLAGGAWEANARKAAAELSGDRDDDGSSNRLGNRLLRDCFEAFGDDARLSTPDLIQRLESLPDSQWRFLDGNGLTGDKLARLLKGYGARPFQFRDRFGQKVRGYAAEHFRSAWARYAGITDNTTRSLSPDAAVQPVQPVRGPTDARGDQSNPQNEVPAVPAVPGAPGTAANEPPASAREDLFKDLNPLCQLLAEQLIDHLLRTGSELDLDDVDAVERVLGTDPGQRGAVASAITAVKVWRQSQRGRGSTGEVPR